MMVSFLRLWEPAMKIFVVESCLLQVIFAEEPREWGTTADDHSVRQELFLEAPSSLSYNQCTPSAKSQNYAVLNLQCSWWLVVSPQWVVQFSLVQFSLAGSHRCHTYMSSWHGSHTGALGDMPSSCILAHSSANCCQMKMVTRTVWSKQIFNCGFWEIYWRDCSDLLGLCVAEWDDSW